MSNNNNSKPLSLPPLGYEWVRGSNTQGGSGPVVARWELERQAKAPRGFKWEQITHPAQKFGNVNAGERYEWVLVRAAEPGWTWTNLGRSSRSPSEAQGGNMPPPSGWTYHKEGTDPVANYYNARANRSGANSSGGSKRRQTRRNRTSRR